MAEFAAPTGFAADVAADLLARSRSYGGEHAAKWPAWVEPRCALLSELAVLISGRGDRDPLIASLAISGKWEPARRVESLVASVLVVPQPSKPALAAADNERCAKATAELPNAQALLHQLTVAVCRDEIERARRIRDQAASELLAVQPDARLEAAESRAAKAELQSSRAAAESARARASEEALQGQVGLLRAELRFHAEQAGTDPEIYVAAVLAKGEPADEPTDEPSEEEELPKGIRRRDSGKYEALIYRAESIEAKQRSAGTYETLEEAVAAREAALQRELEPEQVAA
jgi:hypothetical protein